MTGVGSVGEKDSGTHDGEEVAMDAAIIGKEQAGRGFADARELRPGNLSACPDTGVGLASRAPSVSARMPRV